MESTRREKERLKSVCAFASMVVAWEVFAAPALIPAPREMTVALPCVEIKDAPAFKWRGVQIPLEATSFRPAAHHEESMACGWAMTSIQ